MRCSTLYCGTFYLGTVASYPGLKVLLPQTQNADGPTPCLGDGSVCHLSLVEHWEGGHGAPGRCPRFFVLEEPTVEIQMRDVSD